MYRLLFLIGLFFSYSTVTIGVNSVTAKEMVIYRLTVSVIVSYKIVFLFRVTFYGLIFPLLEKFRLVLGAGLFVAGLGM